MDETKPTGETVGDSENQYEQRQQQIVDMGSTTITTARGTIHTLTIVGQIEAISSCHPRPRPPSTST